MCDNVLRVAVVEPVKFNPHRERHRLTARDRQLAESVAAGVHAANPDRCSDDYLCGFKAGFTDYLTYGGAAAAPLLPPRRYWRSDYRSPLGQQAIHDWFAGFRDGAATAQRDGFREGHTVPSSLLLPGGGLHEVHVRRGLAPVEAGLPRDQDDPSYAADPSMLSVRRQAQGRAPGVDRGAAEASESNH
jgi:hypothetical protein